MMDEKQQAIEKIASIFCELYPCDELKNKKITCPDKTCSCNWIIDKLLYLKSDSGNPLLAIVAADQSLPENPIPITFKFNDPRYMDKFFHDGYNAAQKHFQEEGWVKILK